MYKEVIDFIKSLYPNQKPVPLHAPVFLGNEKKYLLDCIDSTYISYVGKYVSQFEETTAKYTGSKYAVAVVNGTTALQIALKVAGVEYGDEVITQPLTFVATANAISHTGASPIFIDVDLDTMGMSPNKLEHWLKINTIINKDYCCINKLTKKKISALVPMHTFGFPCRITDIVKVANKYNIPVIEDSAESLGSYYKNKHTGTFGLAGIISYNGNKTITTGGGGIIITDNKKFAQRAKHLTTTAKIPHRWEYVHDEIGYNYRMTNLNAAVGVAQMEKLDIILKNKRETANKYNKFFISQLLNEKVNNVIRFKTEPDNSLSNYWLSCVQLKNKKMRDIFVEFANNNGVLTRPIWRLINKLEMYINYQIGDLENSKILEERIVSIPSGFRK